MLHRVFPLRIGAGPLDDGGALHVPRDLQSAGRHDNPERYGALYAARAAESAVAEYLQAFRGQLIEEIDLRRRDGRPYALGTLDDARVTDVVDLDDPGQLVARELRPSRVATRERATTRPLALAIFREGVSGFAWWSTLEAAWINVTLFAERAAPRLRVTEIQLLSVRSPVVRLAAEALGIRLRG